MKKKFNTETDVDFAHINIEILNTSSARTFVRQELVSLS